jgi:hypothetical protein
MQASKLFARLPENFAYPPDGMAIVLHGDLIMASPMQSWKSVGCFPGQSAKRKKALTLYQNSLSDPQIDVRPYILN